MTKVLLVTHRHFVKLSDRRAAAASRGEPSAGSRELPPHTARRTVIRMKSFVEAAVMLAIAALVIGQSAAQTGTPSPGGMGATSPLGADFSTPAASSQGTAMPYSGTANPAPCSTGNLGSATLPTFDGGGINLSGLPGAAGVATSTSVPCNSVSSSGVMNSSISSATIATSSSSSSSSNSGTSTTATPNSAPNAVSLGIAGLGTTGLGTTSLGTSGLGTAGLNSITGPTSQTSTASTAATDSLSACPDLSGTAGTTASGTVPDPASSAIPDPAQTLSGGASLPTQCLNPGPGTGTSPAGGSMITE